ncbi:unnamed protein product [Closterium sp. NIES-54]
MLCCIVHCRGEPAGAGGTLHEGGGAEGRARDGDGRKGHAGHGHGADAAQLFNKSLLFYPISPCTVLCVLFCAGAMRRGAALCAAGENRLVQEALCTRAVGQRGVRVLVMDGGGMRGMAMVQMLRQIEGRTGRRVHELFDLVCGTSTGGMLAAELGIKRLTLDQCDDVYRRLGKLVFSNVEAMESASWRDKLDQLYKSSSQNYRVVVHGSKVGRVKGACMLGAARAMWGGRQAGPAVQELFSELPCGGAWQQGECGGGVLCMVRGGFRGMRQAGPAGQELVSELPCGGAWQQAVQELVSELPCGGARQQGEKVDESMHGYGAMRVCMLMARGPWGAAVDKLHQLYKSSLQNQVHGSKVRGVMWLGMRGQFERLLLEMCMDGDGDLLIGSTVSHSPSPPPLSFPPHHCVFLPTGSTMRSSLSSCYRRCARTTMGICSSTPQSFSLRPSPPVSPFSVSRLSRLSFHPVFQHNAEQFEQLLQEMCTDDNGDLLFDLAVILPPLPPFSASLPIPALPSCLAAQCGGHNAEQFEQLLQEMCTDDDGDLLIDSAVKGGPKVFVVSTLVSVTPATPFVFRNYQVSSLT